MNKLMLGAAAVALSLAVSPAFAAEDSGVKLSLGGHFIGYANYSNEDTARHTDLLRDTEVHFGGETTLDNGLTVGAHIETFTDAADSFDIDESYVYFAGSWGRVNVGEEDAAAYLLQVSAPSADANVDGLRPYITPTQMGSLSYDNDLAKEGDKLTYLSPVFSGFQVGASYTPETSHAVSGGNRADAPNTGVTEAAVRYEGMVGSVGLISGAGYEATTEGDREWNVGVDLDIGAFGVGAAYVASDAGETGSALVSADQDIIVLGADYTTGPFKLGASYLNRDIDGGVETDRYTAGVVYTYGPGMTFRGSVGYRDEDTTDATTVTLGTQVNF